MNRRQNRSWEKIGKERLLSLFQKSEETNHLFSMAFDSLSGGVMVCDRQHTILQVNKTALRLFSLPNHLLESDLFVWDLIPHSQLANYVKRNLLEEERVENVEFHYSQPEEGDRIFSLSIHPMVSEQSIRGSILWFSDITEQKKSELQQNRNEYLASLTTLSAGIAHEIKNPLESISLYTRLVQKTLEKTDASRGDLAPEQRRLDLLENLSIIQDEIARLNRLVVEYLSAVRPLKLELLPCDLIALLQEVVQLVRVELEENSVDLNLDLPPTPLILSLDREQMKQVFLNLIQNSVVAMTSNRSNSSRKKRELTIGVRVTEGGVLVFFKDNGVGIPESDYQNIFTPYFSTKENGTGLGLTIVNKIIHEHAAEISLTSEVDEGTTMKILFPIKHDSGKVLEWRGESDEEGESDDSSR